MLLITGIFTGLSVDFRPSTEAYSVGLSFEAASIEISDRGYHRSRVMHCRCDRFSHCRLASWACGLHSAAGHERIGAFWSLYFLAGLVMMPMLPIGILAGMVFGFWQSYVVLLPLAALSASVATLLGRYMLSVNLWWPSSALGRLGEQSVEVYPIKG